MEEVNEDCGCGGTTDNIRSFNTNSTPRYSQDPLVGKRVSLRDGRSGLVDDSIRNNTEPLFIVDGNVVSSIDFIVPNEVLSINVLKDAEASIYGSRGSSGVIVIKLKK